MAVFVSKFPISNKYLNLCHIMNDMFILMGL